MIAGLSQTRRVRVDFACNDDAGDVAGEALAIQIGAGGPLLELEAIRRLRFAIEPVRFMLGRRAWPHLGRVHWSGSMVWDGLWMAVDQAAYFLGWLHAGQLFALTTGESALFRAWHAGSFGGAYLHEQLAAVGCQQGAARV